MNIIIIILLIVFSLFAYVRYVEKTAVFYPDRNIEQDPSYVGLNFEDIMITTADGEILHAWWIVQKTDAQTLLFLHGNAGNISHRLEKVSFFHQLGFNILIVDYRGYGKSTGSPTEQGVYLDAQAAYEFLRSNKNIEPKNIIIYGASLGGAIATDLASKKEVAGLILDSTFTSAVDMGRLMFPWIPTSFMALKFDSVQKIKTIQVPKLIFHSTDDETVPFHLGQKLFDVATKPKTFVTTVGGHNDEHVISRELLEENIQIFMRSLDALHE